jgi:hypothetical protein
VVTRRAALSTTGHSLAAAMLAATGLIQARPVEARCRDWILSGGLNPTDEIHVDDDLTVKRNGKVIFRDDDQFASDISPINFSARKGDRIQVSAINAQPPCRSLSPIYLHCAAGGNPRKITDGVAESCADEPAGRFFRKTITI